MVYIYLLFFIASNMVLDLVYFCYVFFVFLYVFFYDFDHLFYILLAGLEKYTVYLLLFTELYNYILESNSSIS